MNISKRLVELVRKLALRVHRVKVIREHKIKAYPWAAVNIPVPLPLHIENNNHMDPESCVGLARLVLIHLTAAVSLGGRPRI